MCWSLFWAPRIHGEREMHCPYNVVKKGDIGQVSVSVKKVRKEECQVLRKCTGENSHLAWRVREESVRITGILTVSMHLLHFLP